MATKYPNLDANRALAKLCERRFYRFFLEMWETIEATTLVPNWHIELICDELQEMYEIWARGESQPDGLFNVPPGSSKSTIMTQLFPAWLWVKNRSIRVISSSYAADLATAHAVKTRDCLKSEKFNALWPRHIIFKNDTDGKTHYKNIHGGERFVSSTGGSVTGMHADFILNDDPINPERAASEDELKKAVRYCGRTLSTRKTDKDRTVSILLMQRLADNDPSGDMIEKYGTNLRHICLPGELTPDMPDDAVKPERARAKYFEGLMDRFRLGRAALAKLRIDLGSYGFAGQIQQTATPLTGGIWQSGWIIPVSDQDFPALHLLSKHGTDWDTAYTDNTDNAATAYVESGTYNGKMWINDIGFFHAIYPEMIKQMKLHTGPHYIEAKASGKSAKQSLQTMGIVAIEVQVPSDKIARAKDATPKAEAGMVCIRRSLWDKLHNDDQQGILRFPKAPKADLADTLAQAILRHFGKVIVKRAKKHH